MVRAALAVFLALACVLGAVAPAAAAPDAAPDARPIVIIAPGVGGVFPGVGFGVRAFRPWAVPVAVPVPAFVPAFPPPAFVPAQLALPGVPVPTFPAYTPNTSLAVGASPATAGPAPVPVTCWYYPAEQQSRC
jgi:hypothetical protein